MVYGYEGNILVLLSFIYKTGTDDKEGLGLRGLM